MKLPKYVQHWVDDEGRPHCYFRRRGFPRVPLKGLPWSPSFMAEYEKAMSGARIAVVTGKPESVEPDNPWPLDEFRTKENKQ